MSWPKFAIFEAITSAHFEYLDIEDEECSCLHHILINTLIPLSLPLLAIAAASLRIYVAYSI